MNIINDLPVKSKNFARTKRREFLKRSMIIGIAGISGTGYLSGCGNEGGEEVTPAEDLMREHGVLNRILLIYDNIRIQVSENKEFPAAVLKNSAEIIRNFIESYHEKLEEDFLFPRFEKAGVLADLVSTLRTQHQAGRRLTEEIIRLAGLTNIEDPVDNQNLASLLRSFNSMYRPHEAREDTILFPAIKQIIKGKEYLELGEQFEDKEHELFGEEGFEGIVEKVSSLEKKLGIYELAQFTPVLNQVSSSGQ